jgi:sn-glycerol 3-phosphate transport system ATP-binding protein
MATLSLKDVRKRYGKTEVIHGVSINVEDGEFVVIVGPSGCGKSTLLRMVAGLEAITSGIVEIGGRVVNALEPRERDIAMVFQNYALYPHMTVAENMAYGLRIGGMPKAERDEKVRRAAEMLDLLPYLARKPRALSGGQRQRVAMGRALVRDPAAFLFDEPLSNLDAKLRVQMRLQIKELQRTVGITSLYVTHDQVEAMTLADRLIVMNAGVAEQIDTPMAIYDRPANIFVAGFIGSPAMNILPAGINRTGDGVIIDGGPEIALPQRLPAAIGPLQSVKLGIRPEHFSLAPAGAAGSFPVIIHAVETLGADAYVHGRLSAASPESLVVLVPGHMDLTPGRAIHVAPNRAMLHLFDPATGRRL